MCLRTLTGDEVNPGLADLTVCQDAKERQPKKWKNLSKEKSLNKTLHEIKNSSDCEKKEKCDILEPVITVDFLKMMTMKFSDLCNKCNSIYLTWKKETSHRIKVSTAQLAHLVMILAILCVTSAFLPSNERKILASHSHSQIISFIYLTSFVIHFGSQIWMTFVSGLSLYFALPRHTFSEVQRVLFPRYFTINTCLSFITLLIFVKHHPASTWDCEVTIQVAGMTIAFFLELLIRLYLTPPLMHLIVQKNSIELTANVGNEIGHQKFGALKHCPHYLKIHKHFRRVHSLIAVGNICTMACTILHLYYISSKLGVLL